MSVSCSCNSASRPLQVVGRHTAVGIVACTLLFALRFLQFAVVAPVLCCRFVVDVAAVATSAVVVVGAVSCSSRTGNSSSSRSSGVLLEIVELVLL